MSTLRHALRSLVRAPGFTIVALLTLALGIGANTAMFSVTDALLLRPGPFAEPEQLVRLFGTSPQSPRTAVSLAELERIRAQSRAVTDLTAFSRWYFTLAEPGRPAERVNSVRASAELFSFLRLQPALGRAFTAAETRPGEDGVVLLSHSFWQSRFAGDPAVVGRTLTVDGEPVMVVGVMPPRAEYGLLWGDVGLWRPLALNPAEGETPERRSLQAVGRLSAGTTLSQARAELGTIALNLARDFAQSSANRGLLAVPLAASLVGDTQRMLTWVLLALSGFVLAIACANLVLLQLSRCTARSREFAIRCAIGASRWQLARPALAESLVLALSGGALGLLAAAWSGDLLARTFVLGTGAPPTIQLDERVALFALFTSVLAGVLVGVIPALLAARADVAGALKQQSTTSTAGRPQRWLRHSLIVAQFALALVLLSGAAFLTRGLQQFQARDIGWSGDELVLATVNLPDGLYPKDKLPAFYDKLHRQLSALPGVSHVAFGSSFPTRRFDQLQPLAAEGRPQAPAGQQPLAYSAAVTADYFAALKVPVVAGRTFSADLRVGSPAVVVINESLARRFWPGESPIGKRLAVTDPQERTWMEVIGVVRDVDFAGDTSVPETTLQFYRPFVQDPWDFFRIAIRCAAPGTLEPALREAIAAVDLQIAVYDVRTAREHVALAQHDVRSAHLLLSGFAALGLLLAAIGLYGVISGLVAQRRPEFAIRMALGAAPGDMLRQVLGSACAVSSAGIGVGVLGAFGLLRLLATALPRFAGVDWASLTVVALILTAVTFVASWLPARAATRVDPIEALRAE